MLLYLNDVEFLLLAGVKFCKAIFVPNQSVYNKVTSHATPTADIQQVDLSWQLKVQRVWENIIHSEQGTVDFLLAFLSS